MLKVSLTVRTADEARTSIDKLRALIDDSDIPGAARSFLIGAASETLELWGTQLARPNTKFLKAERTFEGGDYRIVLKARSKSLGIIGLLRRSLGIR
jgi:hypothetical protein